MQYAITKFYLLTVEHVGQMLNVCSIYTVLIKSYACTELFGVDTLATKIINSC